MRGNDHRAHALLRCEPLTPHIALMEVYFLSGGAPVEKPAKVPYIVVSRPFDHKIWDVHEGATGTHEGS